MDKETKEYIDRKFKELERKIEAQRILIRRKPLEIKGIPMRGGDPFFPLVEGEGQEE